MVQWGLSNVGFYVPSFNEILVRIRDEVEARTQKQIDWTPENILTEITAIFAARAHDAWVGLGAVYDGADPDTATGYQLDSIAALTGLRRIMEVHSTVVVTLSGDANTIVVEGKVVEDTLLQRWVTTEDVTIGTGGTVDVLVSAAEPGPVRAEAGSITTIVTPVFGWDSVTNALAATPGRNRETDTEFRLRRQQSLQAQRGGSLAAIRRVLLGLDFLRSATVLENDTDITQTIAGIDVPPHSVAPFLYSTEVGGELSLDVQREIVARLLYTSVVGGIQVYGEDDSATVTGGDGHPKTVAWSYADAVTVNVVVTVGGVSVGTVEDEVEDIVELYF